MRIALAGSGRLGVGLLGALSASSHDVVAIVQDGRVNRSLWRWIVPLMGRMLGGRNSITGIARRKGIPLVWIDKMDERELAPLRKLDIDVLLVGGFSIILKEPLLSLPKMGCVNTHSSLLPKHRGPNPFYAAIISGDKESGVSFHVMEAGIDSGAVLHQVVFELSPRESMMSLYVRACDLATEEIVALMDRIAVEGLQGTPQDESQANYVKNPTLDDAWLDWDRPAEHLDRMVRAMCPRIMPRFLWQGRQILVLRSRWEKGAENLPAPGTVLGLRPLRVTTGEGVFIIEGAIVKRPVYWLWPNPWQKVRVGDLLKRDD